MQDQQPSRRALIDKISDLLTSYVVPLYLDIRNKPVHVGSGFFVRCMGQHFLVTAAHVLDERKHGDIYYYIEPNRVRLLDGVLRTTLGASDRQQDKQDVGVVHLTNLASPPYPAVRKLVMDIHELRPRAVPRAGKSYLVLGFPTSKNKANPVRVELPATAWSYHGGSATIDLYSARGVGETSHVILNFDVKRGYLSDGTTVRFPSPKGMSGSPIWMINDGESQGAKHFGFPVVAIATEHSERSRIIQGTDISVALDLIGGFLAR